jgi:hypothetical protein
MRRKSQRHGSALIFGRLCIGPEPKPLSNAKGETIEEFLARGGKIKKISPQKVRDESDWLDLSKL